jgi:ketosteroid isomerase-like protein
VSTQTGADHIEIHELFARYYVAVDTHDSETWFGLWAEDGVFDSGRIRAEGMDELRTFTAGHKKMNLQTRHFCTNVFVDVDGDEASATNYMLVRSTVDQSAQSATALCESKLRKVDGEWKFTEHVYETDPSFDFGDAEVRPMGAQEVN